MSSSKFIKKNSQSKSDFNEGEARLSSTRTEIQTSADKAAEQILEQASTIEPTLTVYQGSLPGKVYRLSLGKSRIGRNQSCEIPLDQRNVSGHHATLERLASGGVVLSDNQSTNGIEVNGAVLKAPALLKAGDLVKIGGTVFRFADTELDAAFTENLHHQMTRDALTGIYNRDYLMKSLIASLNVAKAGYPLSVVMFDLDHFKKVNDTYGHLAGDYVLKETCRVLMDTVVRSEDTFGRYGGEEFLIVMPDCPLNNAIGVAERARKTIAEHVYSFEGKTIPVTTSLGVCAWLPKHKTPENLVGAVDELLYKSKTDGRNRVSFST